MEGSPQTTVSIGTTKCQIANNNNNLFNIHSCHILPSFIGNIFHPLKDSNWKQQQQQQLVQH